MMMLLGIYLHAAVAYAPDGGCCLCDASYFLCIGHMPMLLAFQLCLAPLPWPLLLKVPVALAGTSAALLLLYHWAVRPTWVGMMLNGRRYGVPRTGWHGMSAERRQEPG